MSAALVPAPRHVEHHPGPPLRLDGTARVVTDDAALGTLVAQRLGTVVGRPGGVTTSGDVVGPPLPVVPDDDGAPGAVVLRLADLDRSAPRDPDAAVPPEATVPGAYRLDVTPDRAVVTAADRAGLLHGAVTLEQLLTRPEGAPPCTVADAPRFGWRGLMVDVARHFMDVPTVLALLDVMTGLKLTHLHLHLTDDQGWRLAVPSRPRLVEASSATAVGGDPGGFYTAEDYALIQSAAADRGITVVPEIDLPGHVNAALHAYGELTPSGEPAEPYTGIDVGFSRLHADLPATAPFVRDVLADVAAMTRGAYVHIGGDEALTMSDAEYRTLAGLAADAVRAAGKTVIGWQELARTSPGPGTVVQYWDERADADAVTRAARAGARVLLSPATRVYLDMKPDADSRLGLDWAGLVPLRAAYDWEPLEVLPDVPADAVVGVEAAIWSETLRTPEDLFAMLLPRLAAFAEVAWSAPQRRDWADFAARLPALAPGWTAAGLAWTPLPGADWPEA